MKTPVAQMVTLYLWFVWGLIAVYCEAALRTPSGKRFAKFINLLVKSLKWKLLTGNK